MFKFIKYPVYHPLSNYTKAIEEIIENLNRNSNVIAVYQIGSVSTPGISDIDIIAVFKDYVFCDENYLENLSDESRKLFTHGIFGISKSNFSLFQKYAYHIKLIRLKGEDLSINLNKNTSLNRDIKTQIALEYLIKTYVGISINMEYKIFKVSSLLSEMPKLKIDFKLLNQNPPDLIELINELIEYRSSWFDKPRTDKQLSKWILRFYSSFEKYVFEVVSNNKFYLPQLDNRLGRNVFLKNNHTIKMRHLGISQIEPFLPIRYKFPILNRVNKFYFYFPISNSADNSEIKERFDILNQLFQYNLKYLPKFQALVPSLAIYNN